MCTAGAESRPVHLNGTVVPRVKEGSQAEEGGSPRGDFFGWPFHFLLTYIKHMTDTEVALVP